jgi:hypothetical protein
MKDFHSSFETVVMVRSQVILPSFRTPILGSVEHEYEAQGGWAGTLKLSRLLLALNNLLNNDHFMQHCSNPRLNSSQLHHAALLAGQPLFHAARSSPP